MSKCDGCTLLYSEISGDVYLGAPSPLKDSKGSCLCPDKKKVTGEFLGISVKKFGPQNETVIHENGNPAYRMICVPISHGVLSGEKLNRFKSAAYASKEALEWCIRLIENNIPPRVNPGFDRDFSRVKETLERLVLTNTELEG